MNGDASKAAGLVAQIQKLVDARKDKGLKSFVVFMGGAELKGPIEKIAAERKITVPLTFLPGGTGSGDIAYYRISPQSSNTILLWKNQQVTHNFVDVKPNAFGEVEKAVDALLQ